MFMVGLRLQSKGKFALAVHDFHTLLQQLMHKPASISLKTVKKSLVLDSRDVGIDTDILLLPIWMNQFILRMQNAKNWFLPGTWNVYIAFSSIAVEAEGWGVATLNVVDGGAFLRPPFKRRPLQPENRTQAPYSKGEKVALTLREWNDWSTALWSALVRHWISVLVLEIAIFDWIRNKISAIAHPSQENLRNWSKTYIYVPYSNVAAQHLCSKKMTIFILHASTISITK